MHPSLRKAFAVTPDIGARIGDHGRTPISAWLGHDRAGARPHRG